MHESTNFFRGRTPVCKMNRRLTRTALCAFFAVECRIVKGEEDGGKNARSIFADERIFEHVRAKSRRIVETIIGKSNE